MGAPAICADAVEAAAERFLERIDRPGRLLVAISGGGDSTALLHALHNASHPVELVAATVDHGLRPESMAEAEQVGRFCASLGVPHRVLHWLGAKPASGLQEAGRLARYRLLREAATETGASAVVTGHTLDDQIETVAMRAARTAEGGGLAGMAGATLFAGDCWILRPLLTIEREALRAYLTRNGVGWIDDPSNENRAFERVRVRQSGTMAPDIAAIAEAGRARGENAARIAEVIATRAENWSGALFALPRADAVDDAYIGALLELACLAGGAEHLPGRSQCADLAAFIAAPGSGRCTLSRAVVDKRRDRIFVHREHRSLPAVTLAPGESIVWDRRFTIRNGGTQPLIIGPGQRRPVETEQDMPPPALLAAASATLPHVLVEGEEPLPAAGARAPLQVAARSARHDTFLPGFDLIMGNALAVLLGRQAYPKPPLRPA